MHRFTRALWMGCLLILSLFSAFAQSAPPLWQLTDGRPDVAGERRIQPDAYQLFQADFPALTALLKTVPKEIPGQRRSGTRFAMPMPDGSLQEIEILRTEVLSYEDEAQYPDILTFVGHGIDDPYAYVRLDLTPHGFHAMLLTAGDSYWVDPYVQGNTTYYMAYRKSDLRPRQGEDYSCRVNDPTLDIQPITDELFQQGVAFPTGTELRIYELALACVGEYAQFHGGTKPLVQGAMVTSINRVTGIFERDMSIRLVFIPGNDTLIYLDPATDVFSCCNLGQTIDTGDSLINAVIGPANFDIGHTYCTYGGGAAAFGVCESPKAVAATGLTNPVGDPFDVDYVSHEIGHQFHAAHTFNYCPGPGGVPHEPGSGSTIMAYAGLCGSANIQTFSVDAFSVGTYEQSGTFSQTGAGNTCPDILPTNNTPPTVTVPQGGFFIPKSTAFELTASGSDADGDSLTYSWEQWDLGTSAHPDTPSGNSPLFRVLWPTPTPTRIFPQIEDLVMGTQTIGERLPDYGRPMTFRCAIRDNRGGAHFAQMQFTVVDTAGPFVLTYPNTGVGFWTAGSIETITWDVAGSDLAPINCQAVDIYLSTDGGYTYPIVLATNRPNTGTTAITVPQITGANMRVKVKGAGNHFFDISNDDFAIVPPNGADYSLTVNEPSETACGADTARFIAILDSLGPFGDPIALTLLGLPTGAGFSLTQNTALAPDTVQVKVWNDAAPAGNYSLSLQANSTTGVKAMPLTLKLRTGSPAAVSPIAPFNGAIGVPLSPTFSWNVLPFLNSYRLQVDISPTFSNPVLAVSGMNATVYAYAGSLSPNTVYYWRVQADTSACGAGPWGPIYSFQTPLENCATYTSTDVPTLIPSENEDTVYSTLNVPGNLILNDVNVLNLQGVHTWMDDLAFSLISPQQTQVSLFGFQCGDQDDFWFSFDDAASNAAVPCPPTTGLTYQPSSPLSAFNGEDAQGTWTLEVIDRFAADGGQVDSWSLELCGPVPTVAAPTLLNDSLTLVQGDSAGIDSVYLQADCSDSSSQATYTLLSLPTHGELWLAMQPLAVGDTFTQSDIDAGLLTYGHDSLTAVPDGFQFTLTCSGGGFVGGLAFGIAVTPDTMATVGVQDLANPSIRIFPNPAQQRFQLVIEGKAAANVELRMYDLMGRQVLTQKAFGKEMQVEIKGLSAGLYTVAVYREGRLLGVEKLRRE